MTPPRGTEILGALELHTPSPKSEGSSTDHEYAIGELLRRVAACEGHDTELARKVGEVPSEEDRDGSGLCGDVACLRRTVGEPPNEATGYEGSGMCRVLAGVARAEKARTAALVKAVAVGTGSAFGLLELGQQIWKAFGG